MKRFLSASAAAVLVIGGAALASPPAHAAQPSYSVMLLQVAPGPSPMRDAGAHALNDRGDVVGMSTPIRMTIDGGEHSTLWPARSGVGITLAPGFPNSRATGISGAGNIIGSYFQFSPPWAYYYSGGAARRVTVDGATAAAAGMSENGVGLFNVLGSEHRAYTATSATNLVELPPPAGGTDAVAVAISDNGSRIVGSYTSSGVQRQVIWTERVPAAMPAIPGASDVALRAITDAGRAVGCAVAGGTRFAFTQDSGTTIRLGAPQGSTASCAQALNRAGLIGGWATIGGQSAATLWIDGSPVDLNTLVPQRSGYRLLDVSDVNASGQVVGTARLTDGTLRGFIATPSTPVTVYTTPGYHELNGRQWRTECSPYSQTTRCRTDIVATTVKTVNGSHTRVTDWTFNNLTYTPSPRALWTGNPLATEGSWIATDGRQWRTECDSAATGRGACRSEIHSTVVEAVPNTHGGYTFRQSTTWVFNNIVRFTN